MEAAGPEAEELFRRGYEALRLLEGDGAPKAVSLETGSGRPVMKIDAPGFVPVSRALFASGAAASGSASASGLLARTLTIAIHAAGSLSRLHRNGLLHNAISPDSLLVHPDTLDIVYIGFEHAVHDALPPPGSAKRADKLLSYINRILPVGLCSFRWRPRSEFRDSYAKHRASSGETRIEDENFVP